MLKQKERNFAFSHKKRYDKIKRAKIFHTKKGCVVDEKTKRSGITADTKFTLCNA